VVFTITTAAHLILTPCLFTLTPAVTGPSGGLVATIGAINLLGCLVVKLAAVLLLQTLCGIFFASGLSAPCFDASGCKTHLRCIFDIHLQFHLRYLLSKPSPWAEFMIAYFKFL
jgi:hypothetical protein